MITCVDVFYRGRGGTAGCILFGDWRDGSAAALYMEHIEEVLPYEPGRFYLRELPCILRVISKVPGPLHCVVIDGYVWLGEERVPGLGAHLFESLQESVPVIGVAKSAFKGALQAEWIFRGRSRRPLYITAAGMDPLIAADCIRRMHGRNRIPTLLKDVDRLCRQL